MQRKDLPAAAELYERALVIAEKANGPKHPSLAVILTGLGEARRNLGDRNAARIAYMRALAIFRAGGEGESERDATLRGLGNLALESGDLKQARARFRDVLEYQEKLYRGADHPRLVRSLLGMGKVHLAEGKPDEARPLLERALRIAEGTTVDLDLIAEVRAALAKATR